MEQIDLNEVITMAGDAEQGIAAITKGAVICLQVRNQLRDLLKSTSPKKYEEYREIKYPGGAGSQTHETCVAATRFLFDAARDLLATYYVSTRIGEK